jgi:hypothetical protein
LARLHTHPPQQAKLADFGLHKRVRAILKSGLALPWAQDISLQGDACEKSFYGGNMYASNHGRGAAAGAEGARAAFGSGLYGLGGAEGSMHRPTSYANLLGRVTEDGDAPPSGALPAAPTAGLPPAGLPRPGSLRDLQQAAGSFASADIATRVLSSSGVGDTSRHEGSRSGAAGAPGGAPGAGSPGAGAPGAGGSDASVHRRLAAVQALEGSVRAGSAFHGLGPAGASPGSSGRGAGGGGGVSDEIQVLVEDAPPGGAGGWGKGGAGGAADGAGSGRGGSGRGAAGAGTRPGGGSARGGQLASQRGVLVDATQKVGTGPRPCTYLAASLPPTTPEPLPSPHLFPPPLQPPIPNPLRPPGRQPAVHGPRGALWRHLQREGRRLLVWGHAVRTHAGPAAGEVRWGDKGRQGAPLRSSPALDNPSWRPLLRRLWRLRESLEHGTLTPPPQPPPSPSLPPASRSRVAMGGPVPEDEDAGQGVLAAYAERVRGALGTQRLGPRAADNHAQPALLFQPLPALGPLLKRLRARTRFTPRRSPPATARTCPRTGPSP